jgi:hypothetical protein
VADRRERALPGAIFNSMSQRKNRLVRDALFALLLGATALMAPSTLSTAATKHAKAGAHTLLQSRLLWATIDVCGPSDHPNTVGIRGSMPGDGQSHDKMYMRFRLQYMDPSAKHWVDLPKGGSSGYISVGTGASPRQGGTSFTLGSAAGKSAFTMRGVVSFQWRHGTHVVTSTSRPTSAGRVSLVGSDPAGFSAATCIID